MSSGAQVRHAEKPPATRIVPKSWKIFIFVQPLNCKFVVETYGGYFQSIVEGWGTNFLPKGSNIIVFEKFGSIFVESIGVFISVGLDAEERRTVCVGDRRLSSRYVHSVERFLRVITSGKQVDDVIRVGELYWICRFHKPGFERLTRSGGSSSCPYGKVVGKASAKVKESKSPVPSHSPSSPSSARSGSLTASSASGRISQLSRSASTADSPVNVSAEVEAFLHAGQRVLDLNSISCAAPPVDDEDDALGPLESVSSSTAPHMDPGAGGDSLPPEKGKKKKANKKKNKNKKRKDRGAESEAGNSQNDDSGVGFVPTRSSSGCSGKTGSSGGTVVTESASVPVGASDAPRGCSMGDWASESAEPVLEEVASPGDCNDDVRLAPGPPAVVAAAEGSLGVGEVINSPPVKVCDKASPEVMPTVSSVKPSDPTAPKVGSASPRVNSASPGSMQSFVKRWLDVKKKEETPLTGTVKFQFKDVVDHFEFDRYDLSKLDVMVHSPVCELLTSKPFGFDKSTNRDVWLSVESIFSSNVKGTSVVGSAYKGHFMIVLIGGESRAIVAGERVA